MNPIDRSALAARIELTEKKPDHYQGSMAADFDHPGMFFVLLDGQPVGDFCVELLAHAWQAHAYLLEPWRGMGIASLVYDLVDAEARRLGSHLEPSPVQTDDAQLFWARRSARPSQPSFEPLSVPSVNLPPLLVFDRVTSRTAELDTGALGPLLHLGARLRSRARATGSSAGPPAAGRLVGPAVDAPRNGH